MTMIPANPGFELLELCSNCDETPDGFEVSRNPVIAWLFLTGAQGGALAVAATEAWSWRGPGQQAVQYPDGRVVMTSQGREWPSYADWLADEADAYRKSESDR